MLCVCATSEAMTSIGQGTSSASGSISQEDAARIAVLALQRVPKRGLTFAVSRGGQDADLRAMLDQLAEEEPATAREPAR